MNFEVIHGDLLEQDVDVIVNAWNRNIIPWWLLIPQGVSGAIKRKAGYKPFLELPSFKSIPLGEAVLTSAGTLPYKAIIHVAGINLFWRASEYSITNSIKNAVKMALENGYTSMAIPIIGAGSGGYSEEKALAIIKNTLSHLNEHLDGELKIKVIRYQKR